MKYVTVLDFLVGEVAIYSYEEDVEDLEEFIKDKGHDFSDCHWMATDTLKLTIA
jgi:hypothetical protein